MSVKTIFWILVLVLAFYLGFKVVPIFYRGIFGIRAACKEEVEYYKKYGREFVVKRLNESLNEKGMPKDKRTYTVSVTDKAVVVTIDYYDTAEFFGGECRWCKRDFEFHYECEGALRSVW
jgi:hypothetical protein